MDGPDGSHITTVLQYLAWLGGGIAGGFAWVWTSMRVKKHPEIDTVGYSNLDVVELRIRMDMQAALGATRTSIEERLAKIETKVAVLEATRP